jgi:hypothetical protein
MKRLLLVLVVAGIAIGVGTGFAATMTVGSHHLWGGTQTLTKATCTLSGTTSSTDTYVNQASATSSFGTGTTMLVQPDSGSQKWAFIRFDLSQCSPVIPTTGGADTATLKLVVTVTPRSSRTLTVTPIASTWSNTTTWNAAPSFASSATTTFATGTTNNATISIPVTIDVDALIKSSTANYGWRISDGGSAASQDTTTFASSNATSNKPQLVVNYEK